MADSEPRKSKPRIIPPQGKRRERIEIITSYEDGGNDKKREVYEKVIKLFYGI